MGGKHLATQADTDRLLAVATEVRGQEFDLLKVRTDRHRPPFRGSGTDQAEEAFGGVGGDGQQADVSTMTRSEGHGTWPVKHSF
ncbi:hypothetical protein ACFYR1_27465 [Streptomyces canus]|uniref:hypothetical protein n=1 Tax=Streptomyces canus TaxID=58343 RepID=UPI0036C78C68